MRVKLFAVPLLALAACDGAQQTKPEVHTKTDVQLQVDGKTGQVSVNIPGLDAKVHVPKMILDNSHFDLDGVTLYPGSTVSSVNVNAKDRNGAHQADLALSFTAPADPAKVRDWFARALAEKAATVRNEAGALVGQMPDGSAYRFAFAPAGAGQTKGTVEVQDKN